MYIVLFHQVGTTSYHSPPDTLTSILLNQYMISLVNAALCVTAIQQISIIIIFAFSSIQEIKSLIFKPKWILILYHTLSKITEVIRLSLIKEEEKQI